MSSAPSGAYGHELESHNDDLLSGLLGKVDTLKNVSWELKLWSRGGACG